MGTCTIGNAMIWLVLISANLALLFVGVGLTWAMWTLIAEVNPDALENQVLMGLCVGVIVLGLLGLYATYTRRPWLLKVYSLALAVLVLAEIGAVVVFYAGLSDMSEEVLSAAKKQYCDGVAAMSRLEVAQGNVTFDGAAEKLQFECCASDASDTTCVKEWVEDKSRVVLAVYVASILVQVVLAYIAFQFDAKKEGTQNHSEKAAQVVDDDVDGTLPAHLRSKRGGGGGKDGGRLSMAMQLESELSAGKRNQKHREKREKHRP